MKKIVLLFISVLLFASCDNTLKDTEKEVVIKGYLTNSQNEVLFLMELNAERLDVIDSFSIGMDGTFQFDLIPYESPALYVLRSKRHSQSITLIIESEKEVLVDGNLPSLNKEYQIQKSNGSIRVHQLTQIINKRMTKVDAYYTEYRDNPDSLEMSELRMKTDSLLRLNQIGVYEEIRGFIQENPSSLSSLLALYSKFGKTSILDYKFDADLFRLVSDSLIHKYPNNSHSLKLQQTVLDYQNADKLKIEREQSLNVGKDFPNIILNDKEGEPQDLSLCKAKLYVVIAWESKSKASWELNDLMKPIYAKHKPFGLEIFAISFDTDKLAWANYCNMNKWDWINVLGYPHEREVLNIDEKMPRVFILDSDHKIIAKDPVIKDIEEFIAINLGLDKSK